MPCQGPDCPPTEGNRGSQPSANQWVEQVDIAALMLAPQPTAHSETYALLLLAAKAFSQARLIENYDRALSARLDRLASVFGEEALIAGLKAAPNGAKALRANAFP